MQTNRAEANPQSGCVEMLSRWLNSKDARLFPNSFFTRRLLPLKAILFDVLTEIAFSVASQTRQDKNLAVVFAEDNLGIPCSNLAFWY